nr:hypothetical protein [Tanacetum cinerariifolium]
MTKNTKFSKQPIVENLPKVDKTNALSNPVTSNSVSSLQEPKSVNNDKVIAPGMFRINPSKISREEKHIPNTVSASARTKLIIVSQPHVITKKDVNFDLNGLSSTGVDNTKTRRPQPTSNTKNDRVPSTSKSSRSQNKEAEVEEHHRNLLLFKNNEHISSAARSTNLYTINLYEMASASPICLMAHASSTKSWLWHQRKKQKSISSTKTSSKFKAEITSSSYGFVWTNENCQYKWQAVCFGDCGRLLSLHVEAGRTMLIFSRASLLLWAEAIATACFIQNHSIIHCRFNKTPYEIINGRKLDISFLHVFDALRYPKNDRENIGKLGAKGLDLTYARSTITTQQPSEGELDLLFEAMYDDYIGGQPSATARTIPPAQDPQVCQLSTTSTTIADTAPIPTNSSSHAKNILIASQDVDELNPNAMIDGNTFVNPFANSSTSAAASSSHQNDQPLEQVIGEPSRPVLTRNQLRSDGDMCMYALTISTMEPKNVKEAMTDPAWIDSMQEELLQFKRLDVWVLVPAPDNISPLTLKRLFKNKHYEEQTVIRNKSRLVVRGYRQEERIDFEEYFTPCDECKYDKISYDKAYKDMQQKIEQLQAQLGDLKGKSTDTSCVLDTYNPLSQKLENENVELEFQVLNYARENAHLKATYKNLFDSISVSRMFRINPSKTSREEKHVPNTVSANARIKPITVSQPHVITKKDVNSDLNGLSSTGIDNTKTRRPQPRSNTKNDRVPSVSKSSRSQNKEVEVEKHHRNLLLSKNNKHISSTCNNIKIDSQDVISKVVCAMYKKCLISVNHDKCLSKNVNGKNSYGKNQKAKVSVKEIQKKY